MIRGLKQLRNNEIFGRVMFTLMMIVLMELGRHIVIPELDSTATRQVLNNSPLLNNISTVTGGQMNFPSLFSIGLGPYMTGMILFQALRLLDIETLNKMSEDQVGYTQRFISFIIAMIQSFQMIYLVRQSIHLSHQSILEIDTNYIASFIFLVAGAMIVAWMSDMVAKKGIGGSGILIFPGLFTALPRLLKQGQGMNTGYFNLTPLSITLLVICLLIVIISGVFMNKAEERIPLQRPLVENDFSESYLPIRVLAAGSMPFMFSTSLFMIPSYFISLGADNKISQAITDYLNFNTGFGVAVYCLIVVFLGYAFGFMNVRPEETAKNIKESGDYFFNVVPGFPTQQFISRKLIRLSTVANVFYVIIVGLPLVIGLYIDGVGNLTFVFGNFIIMITVLDNLVEQLRVLRMREHYNLLER